MQHPRSALAQEQISQLPISAVSKQILVTLKQFLALMPVLQIKNYIKKDDDFMRLLKSQEESLIRHYFSQLFQKILSLPLQTEGKLSILKVGVAAAIEAKINLTVREYNIVISQMSSIILESSNFDYSLVLKYVISKGKQVYGYSLNLLQHPKLMEVFVQAPSQYHIGIVEVLLGSVRVPDQIIGQTNRIIIREKVGWLQRMASSVLRCSHLILQSIRDGSHCIDPYNMQEIWCQVYDLVDNPEQNYERILLHGLEQIKFKDVLELYRQLDYGVSVQQMGLLSFREVRLPKGYSVSMVSQMWCLFAKSTKYFQYFQAEEDHQEFPNEPPNKQQSKTPSGGQQNASSSRGFFNSLVIDTIRFLGCKDKSGQYWMVPIKSLMEAGYRSSYYKDYEAFCDFLIDHSLIEHIRFYMDKCSANIFIVESMFKILELLCLSRASKFCKGLNEVFELDFFRNISGSASLYYAMGFLTALLNSSKYYPADKVEDAVHILQLVEKGLLENPSQLFIATTLMPKQISSSSLLISTLLVSDSFKIFEDWLKYQYKDQLLNSGNEGKVLEVSTFDDGVAIQLREWVRHYDKSNRFELQKIFGMQYWELRQHVEAIIDIFS